MRILIWEQLRRELEADAAFNMQFLRAIDPRLITHRPRDPEKAQLMSELGMETTVREVSGSPGPKKESRRCIVPSTKKSAIASLDTECEIDP
jgi:hypothetical protein